MRKSQCRRHMWIYPYLHSKMWTVRRLRKSQQLRPIGKFLITVQTLSTSNQTAFLLPWIFNSLKDVLTPQSVPTRWDCWEHYLYSLISFFFFYSLISYREHSNTNWLWRTDSRTNNELETSDPRGFPGGAGGEEPSCRCRTHRRYGPLEKGMATHSSILAWRIPWTEEPGGLQSLGLLRIGHDWSDSTCLIPQFSVLGTTSFFPSKGPHKDPQAQGSSKRDAPERWMVEMVWFSPHAGTSWQRYLLYRPPSLSVPSREVRGCRMRCVGLLLGRLPLFDESISRKWPSLSVLHGACRVMFIISQAIKLRFHTCNVHLYIICTLSIRQEISLRLLQWLHIMIHRVPFFFL